LVNDAINLLKKAAVRSGLCRFCCPQKVARFLAVFGMDGGESRVGEDEEKRLNQGAIQYPNIPFFPKIPVQITNPLIVWNLKNPASQ
jgi:hypothetical protein